MTDATCARTALTAGRNLPVTRRCDGADSAIANLALTPARTCALVCVRRRYWVRCSDGGIEETGVAYRGDTLTAGTAWVPHGAGELRCRGAVVYNGAFKVTA
jgi:hypothetical protein